MPTAKLRQDTVRPLAYVGAHNSPCIYWDDDIPCLGLRGYPADRRTDVVSYGVKYRKRLATLGRADALTLAKRVRAFLGQVRRRRRPAGGRYLHSHRVPKLGSRLAVTITSADIADIDVPPRSMGSMFPAPSIPALVPSFAGRQGRCGRRSAHIRGPQGQLVVEWPLIGPPPPARAQRQDDRGPLDIAYQSHRPERPESRLPQLTRASSRRALRPHRVGPASAP